MVKQRRTERRGGVTVLRIGRCGARVYALRACFYGACLPVAGQHRGGGTVLRIGRRGAMVCALYGDAVDGSARGVRARSEASVGAEEKGHGRGSKSASMREKGLLGTKKNRSRKVRVKQSGLVKGSPKRRGR